MQSSAAGHLRGGLYANHGMLMDLFDEKAVLLLAAASAVAIAALTVLVTSVRVRKARGESEQSKAENSRLETQNRRRPAQMRLQ